MGLGLKIYVLHVISEDDLEKQDMGMGFDLNKRVPEEYTLHTIDYTKRYNNKLGIISSAGIDFIVNESYESLESRIEERKTFRFN